MIDGAIKAFGLDGRTVFPINTGLINDTYIIDGNCVLQRINPEVFRNGDAIMHNYLAVTEHIASKSCKDSCIVPIYAHESNAKRGFFIDAKGAYWRCYHYISGKTYLAPTDDNMIEETGRAFGVFHSLTADMREEDLRYAQKPVHEPIRWLNTLKAKVCDDKLGRSGSILNELEYLSEGEAFLEVIAGEFDAMPKRVIHNDAKISNILFDDETKRSICVVDFDTISFGCVLYDFGDMVRSCLKSCESIKSGFEALFRGWLGAIGGVITANERHGIVASGVVVSRELASRYLIDYLEGELYFRVSYEGETLKKAKALIEFCKRYEQSYFFLEEIVDKVITEILSGGRK